MFDLLYENVGTKIKNWAKWIFIVGAISSVILGIVMMVNSSDIDNPLFIFGILIIILGPFIAWISTWILYAFGQLVEDIHTMRTKYDLQIEDKRKREDKENSEHEAKERIKCEIKKQANGEAKEEPKYKEEAKQIVEEKNKTKTEIKVSKKEQIPSNKEKTLSEKLEYALRFHTDEGMIRYLKDINDASVQNILNSPTYLIRDQIQELLQQLQE